MNKNKRFKQIFIAILCFFGLAIVAISILDISQEKHLSVNQDYSQATQQSICLETIMGTYQALSKRTNSAVSHVELLDTHSNDTQVVNCAVNITTYRYGKDNTTITKYFTLKKGWSIHATTKKEFNALPPTAMP